MLCMGYIIIWIQSNCFLLFL